MGNFFNNQRLPENQDSSSSPHYYYPSRNGKFFGSNFIMGGDKFEMAQPEAYLFGDNLDLNYLGGKPNPFPYNAPHPNEPMHMLRSLINIRKETLKLLCTNSDLSDEPQYTIEFVFDSDVDCNITVYFICNEECSVSGMKYISKDVKHRSQQYNYKAGMGQLFSQTNALFDPHQYDAADLLYQVLDEKGEFNSSTPFPVVIHCVAEEGDDPKQSHSLIATIEKVCDDIFSLKPIKQKIFVDGLSYLLQEIYGIENKVNKLEKNYDDDNDNSFECVICMSDLRDTLILPCRHLCLCKSCANSLRYQASNCPICRVPFRALLQIKAVKRLLGNLSSQIIFTETLNDVIIDIPSGFETVPLVEALNGINPQLTYLNLKQSLERLPESDKNNKKDSDSVRSSNQHLIIQFDCSKILCNKVNTEQWRIFIQMFRFFYDAIRFECSQWFHIRMFDTFVWIHGSKRTPITWLHII
ncbi:hypothetical protein BLOT_011572 [Blomia tropicalis]|nr:hypothetical protein BLOT_011572 [Blomia tropicalis]